MELYTVQLAQWREAKKKGIHLLDTTVRSGEAWLAPTWEMVLAIKDGSISEEAYRKLYVDRMVGSYHAHQDLWLSLIKMDKIAIGCYCAAGKFCHRHILRELLEGLCRKQNIPFTYGGELLPTK